LTCPIRGRAGGSMQLVIIMGTKKMGCVCRFSVIPVCHGRDYNLTIRVEFNQDSKPLNVAKQIKNKIVHFVVKE
jgi:hypothetical protein